jgi:hypothetical protein
MVIIYIVLLRSREKLYRFPTNLDASRFILINIEVSYLPILAFQRKVDRFRADFFAPKFAISIRACNTLMNATKWYIFILRRFLVVPEITD